MWQWQRAHAALLLRTVCIAQGFTIMTVNVSGDDRFPLTVSLVNTHLDSRKWRHKEAQVRAPTAARVALESASPALLNPGDNHGATVSARGRLIRLLPPVRGWTRM